MRAADVPSHLDAGLRVRAFFTTRQGGVSRPPYDSLNLGRDIGDDPVAVTRNREILVGLAGSEVFFISQNHSATVVVVKDAVTEPQGDALVTTAPGVAVGVCVADCVPILLHDLGSGAVCAVHAGRMGLALGVVQAAVGSMREVGGRRSGQIEAALGPAICGGCYEVPEHVRDEVANLVPEAWAETTWGTPSLDLRAGVQALLVKAGIPTIMTTRGCTFEDQGLFSHRRDGPTGRQAGVIVCEGS